MIILDDSHVSDRMSDYLQQSGQPVLDTAMARTIADGGCRLNIVAEDEAVSRIEAGERLYAMSESHLDWVLSHINNDSLCDAIRICKDKESMRIALQPLYPDCFFQACDIDELLSMDFPKAALPFVLKPSVGFLSVGVYTVRSRDDWDAALLDIRRNKEEWAKWYDDSVIAPSRFIMESLVEGTEYAIDAYFDDDGHARVLNVLRHDFADPHDTGDRLYYTGVSVMRAQMNRMQEFLDSANRSMHMRAFPVHVEVRDTGDMIFPIEFNPLRFAGLGGTEVSSFAYGFFTFDMYLRDEVPDWERLLGAGDSDDGAAAETAAAAAARPDATDDDLFCMSVLNPPASTPHDARFDYDALWAQVGHPLALDRFDYASTGIFGFLFWKTSAADDTERTWLLKNDLGEFIITA